MKMNRQPQSIARHDGEFWASGIVVPPGAEYCRPKPV